MAHTHAMSNQVPLHKNMKIKACVGQNYLHLTLGLTVNCQCQLPKELTVTEHTDRHTEHTDRKTDTHAQTDTQTAFSPQIPPPTPPLHTHTHTKHRHTFSSLLICSSPLLGELLYSHAQNLKNTFILTSLPQN